MCWKAAGWPCQETLERLGCDQPVGVSQTLPCERMIAFWSNSSKE